MAPNLKLVYFDLAGKAEAIRLAFKLANVEFEDVRLSFEDFGKYKAGEVLEKYPFTKLPLPFGQLPVLIIDDEEIIGQSSAIIRYVGKITGHYPTCPIKAAKIDSFLDHENDIFAPLSVSRYADRFGYGSLTQEQILTIRKELNDKIYPKQLAYLETAIGSGPFLLGSSEPCIADLTLGIRLKWLVEPGVNDGISANLLEAFPKLNALVIKVNELNA